MFNFRRSHVDNYITGVYERLAKGALYVEMKTRYLILKASDFIYITGKKILVIGSLAPWVEAILVG